MENIVVEVYKNTDSKVIDVIEVNNIDTDIINYLKSIKFKNNSIAALYNNAEKKLDVMIYEDEIAVISSVYYLCSHYPGDIADTSLYAIANTNLTKNAMTLLNKMLNFMEKKVKKSNPYGIVKKYK